MSALSDKGITLEGLAAAVDSLRQELATWKALARKQDQLTADQITATQSGATAAKISQIAVNTAAIQSLAAQVAGQISLAYVTALPATGEPLTLYLVPQGDGTAPNFCNEYLWINDAWELIGTTGAMANNGELTIQVNGVTVGTFTANQAANASINIAVPTNTNQLVNGAGFVDTAALQAALLLKQNNLTAVQLAAVDSGITAAGVQQIADNAAAIAGKQDKLSTAQQAAVDSGATAAKIDQIASNASAIVSLTSSKQEQLSTTQLAAVNSGVTASAVQQIGTNTSNISGLQTAVSSKAEDADVVHKAGAETITGDKTFSGAVVTHNITPETDGTYSLGSSSYQWASVYAQTYYYNGTQWGLDTFNQWTGNNKFVSPNTNFGFKSTTAEAGSSTASSNWIYWQDKNDFQDAYISRDIWGDGSDSLRIAITSKRSNEAPSTTGTEVGCCFSLNIHANGSTSITPFDNGGTDLGSSSNKWKTLNGINPGALSLPSHSVYIDILSSITHTDWTVNYYTPSINGYIALNVNGCAIIQPYGTYGISAGFYDGTIRINDLRVCLPVIANQKYEIWVLGTVNEARLFACLGNV